MRLLIGHPDAMPAIRVPVWQNGTPQSMQRAPCLRSVTGSEWSWNSSQSWMRSAGGRASGSSRGNSMNPVGLPISQEPHIARSNLIRIDPKGFQFLRQPDGFFLSGQQQVPLGVPPPHPGNIVIGKFALPDPQFDSQRKKSVSSVRVGSHSFEMVFDEVVHLNRWLFGQENSIIGRAYAPFIHPALAPHGR